MPHDQNAADQMIDEVEYQGQFHFFLADDCCERIGHSESLAQFSPLTFADSFSGKAPAVQTVFPAILCHTNILTSPDKGTRVRPLPKDIPTKNSIYCCKQSALT